MDYLILFMEGIITFISPCILPMLPIYISYFMGRTNDEVGSKKVIINALGFVIGFSIIFTVLGGAAGTLGVFISSNIKYFNIIGGLLLIAFGINYTDVLNINLFKKTVKLRYKSDLNNLNLMSSVIFGMVFSIGWTPCVGTFLGSALMIAANSQNPLSGVGMLLTYSMGLGIPFILSALLIDSLKNTFNFIKRNYKAINMVSGILLIAIGIMMITGYLNLLLSLLTF